MARYNFDTPGGSPSFGSASALYAQANKQKSGMFDDIPGLIDKIYNRREETDRRNIETSTNAGTAALIEQIRAGKIPQKGGIYNAQSVTDAEFNYRKWKSAEDRANAASARASAAHKRAMSGGNGTGASDGSIGYVPYGSESKPAESRSLVESYINNGNSFAPGWDKPIDKTNFNEIAQNINDEKYGINGGYSAIPGTPRPDVMDIPILDAMIADKNTPASFAMQPGVDSAELWKAANPNPSGPEYRGYVDTPSDIPTSTMTEVEKRDKNFTAALNEASRERNMTETERRDRDFTASLRESNPGMFKRANNTIVAPIPPVENDTLSQSIKNRMAQAEEDKNRKQQTILNETAAKYKAMNYAKEAANKNAFKKNVTDVAQQAKKVKETASSKAIKAKEDIKIKNEKKAAEEAMIASQKKSEKDAVKKMYDSIMSTPGKKNIVTEINKYVEDNNMTKPTTEEVNKLSKKIVEMHKAGVKSGSGTTTPLPDKKVPLAEVKKNAETKKKSTLMAEAVAKKAKTRDTTVKTSRTEKSKVRSWAKKQREEAMNRKNWQVKNGRFNSKAKAAYKSNMTGINADEKRFLKEQDDKIKAAQTTYKNETSTNPAVTAQIKKEETAKKEADDIKNAKSKKEFDALNTENAAWKAHVAKMKRVNPDMTNAKMAEAYTGYTAGGNKIYKPKNNSDSGTKTKRGKASGYKALKTFLKKNKREIGNVDEAWGSSGSEDKLNSAVNAINNKYSTATDTMIVEFLSSPEAKGIVDLNDRSFLWNSDSVAIEHGETVIIDAFDKYASRNKIIADGYTSKKDQTKQNKEAPSLPTPK